MRQSVVVVMVVLARRDLSRRVHARENAYCLTPFFLKGACAISVCVRARGSCVCVCVRETQCERALMTFSPKPVLVIAEGRAQTAVSERNRAKAMRLPSSKTEAWRQ